MIIDLDEQRRRRLVHKPWAWRNLSKEAFTELCLSALLDLPPPFNTLPDDAAGQLYGVLCARLDWKERVSFIDRVILEPNFVLRESALLTILGKEFDAPVAAAATARLMAGAPIDPHGVPVSFHEFAEMLCEGTLGNPGAVVAGALMVADRQLITAIEGVRPLLAVDTVASAAQCCCGFASALVVDFWLDWIEELLDNRFDSLALAYAHAAVSALFIPAEAPARHEICEYERVPCSEDLREEAITVVRRWSFDAFRRRIEPRMRRIAAHEQRPRLMQVIMRSWGYD